MFYGLVVKPGQAVALEGEGDILHLSQACLCEPKDSNKTYLTVESEKGTFNVCSLQKDKCEHAALDLFLGASSGVKFSVKGNCDVHLVGYWEPSGGSDDDMDDDDMDGMPEGMHDSDDEEEDVKGGAGMKSLGDIEADFDEDEDDLDDDDECDIYGDVPPELLPAGKEQGKPALFGASNNKQKPNNVKQAQAKQGANKPQAAAHPEAQPKAQCKAKPAEPKAKAAPKASPVEGAKRKADGNAAQPAAKQAKTATSEGSETKFHDDLVEYLTKNGRTTLSELGSKVKKPDGVAKKLAAFIKEKPAVFKVDGSHVELLK